MAFCCMYISVSISSYYDAFSFFLSFFTCEIKFVYNAEWSPMMDVGEHGLHYVVVVELPGVSNKDIRVEVNDKR